MTPSTTPSPSTPAPAQAPAPTPTPTELGVFSLSVDKISPNPNQPRKLFDTEALAELADSIKQHGVIQPLIVRLHGGKYQLVAGERRLRAAKLAGKVVVPVITHMAADTDMLELALIENLHRTDLGHEEVLDGLVQLRDRKLTDAKIATRTCKSKAWVQMHLKCNDKLSAAERALIFDTHDAGYSTAAKIADVHVEDREEVINTAVARGGLTRENVVSAIKSTGARSTAKRAHGNGAGEGEADGTEPADGKSSRVTPAWTARTKVQDMVDTCESVKGSGPEGTGACTLAEVDAAVILLKYLNTNLGADKAFDKLAAVLNRKTARKLKPKSKANPPAPATDIPVVF